MATSITKTLTSADGIEISANAIGNPANPAVVFIHGLALSGVVFDSLFNNKDLLDNIYMVRYDLRGHGKTGKPSTADGYTSKKFAEDFAMVMTAFNVQNPLCVGWSLGATVLTDVLTHSDAVPISGIVYLSALPYIGPVMNEVGTSTVLGFLPGLFTRDDVPLALQTKIAFVESVFTNPEAIPQDIRLAWLGLSVLLPPDAAQLVLSREQDPSKLFEAGRRGLPLLVLNGDVDKQVKGSVVHEHMKPHFSDLRFELIRGGGHASFYEHEKEFVTSLLRFLQYVEGKKK